MMNKLLATWLFLALAPAALAAESGAVAEVEIKNMACPICVRAVGERLRQMPGVQDVKISLKTDTARVVMAPGHRPNAEQLRKAVSEAGFEAGAVTLPPSPDKIR